MLKRGTHNLAAITIFQIAVTFLISHSIEPLD
jgi:hypothetical protein